ncbi:MAG: MFS transporter, partial [Alphaproteobacteria bacterium]|nr:MFS transporter [Alphaproteobacteria bacterium]
AIYLIGFNQLPEDELTKSRTTHTERKTLSRDDRRAIWALFLLCIPLTLYWACYEQQGNTLNLWTAANTDRSINLGFWQGEIPVTWFQSLNPFMIFAFTPLLLVLWTRQAARKREPSSLNKVAFGCLFMMAANLLMVAAAWLAGETGKADWLWVVVYIAVLTMGEIYLSPISLSLYSKIAPPQLVSTMIAVNFIPNFLGGGLLQGWLGTYWSSMNKAEFFLMIAIISGAAAIIVFMFNKPLKPILKE